MHKLLVPASPALERSSVAAWIAEAVGRREKVLYKIRRLSPFWTEPPKEGK